MGEREFNSLGEEKGAPDKLRAEDGARSSAAEDTDPELDNGEEMLDVKAIRENCGASAASAIMLAASIALP